MELDNLKQTWAEIADQAASKQKINLKNFDKMDKIKFTSSLRGIVFPEVLGSIVCIGSAIYIGYNFDRLHSLVYQVAGVVTMLLLVTLPLLSLQSIQQLYKAGDLGGSYAETLKAFSIKKVRFYKLQKLTVTLSYLLLVTVIIISAGLFGRNEVAGSKTFWIYSISIGYIFLLFFSRWVIGGYNKTIKKTQQLLHELSEVES